MPKERFVEEVEAASAEEAGKLVGPRYGKTQWAEVPADYAKLLMLLERRLVRANENPVLYGDQVDRYNRVLRACRERPDDARAVAEAMLDEGSMPWIDGAHRCAVVRRGEGRWLVFGFYVA